MTVDGGCLEGLCQIQEPKVGPLSGLPLFKCHLTSSLRHHLERKMDHQRSIGGHKNQSSLGADEFAAGCCGC